MSRMSDMAQTIEGLRSAAAAISDAADWLTKVFSSEPQAEDAPASPSEPELTLEQVRAVLADKSRQGHTAEIRALLQRYGASKLSQIDPAHYKALLAEAEVLTNGSKARSLIRFFFRAVAQLSALRKAVRSLRGQGQRLRRRRDGRPCAL